MLLTHARAANCAFCVFDGADCFAALHTFPYVLIKMLLTIVLSAFPAFLHMLLAIVLLISADYTLQSVVGSNRALAGGTRNMFLLAATDLPTRLASPAMLLTD